MPAVCRVVLHAHADGIDGPTCVEILQPGYRIGDRILRPARVAVAEPEPEAVRTEPEVVSPEPFDELRTPPVEGRAEATDEPGTNQPDADADR